MFSRDGCRLHDKRECSQVSRSIVPIKFPFYKIILVAACTELDPHTDVRLGRIKLWPRQSELIYCPHQALLADDRSIIAQNEAVEESLVSICCLAHRRVACFAST